MPDHTDIKNTQLAFGSSTADFSGLSISGFLPRALATRDIEPEVFSTATNGEGSVEAIAISKTDKRKQSVSVVGYVTPSFNPASTPQSFLLGGKRYWITKVSAPRPKGEFVEVTIDGQNFPLVS